MLASKLQKRDQDIYEAYRMDDKVIDTLDPLSTLLSACGMMRSSSWLRILVQ